MPYSHHSHSGEFCKHASGTLEDVVLEAIRQRFRVYGLTEHAPRYRQQDLYPEERGLSMEALATQFDGFVREAHRLKDAYASQITLLVGLETEHITAVDLDKLQELLTKYQGRIDYVVGSVHHVGGTPIDFDADTFEIALSNFSVGGSTDQMDNFLSAYFDAQHEILTRFRPEVVGHLDLCRMYNPSLRLQEYPASWVKLERNIKFAAEYGALFEINAAAFRKGWDVAYPGPDVINVIRRHRGRFTLSDDSHGPKAVGLNYARLAEYMRSLDLQDIWTLAKSSGPNASGRPVIPVKVEDDWKRDEFWKRAE